MKILGYAMEIYEKIIRAGYEAYFVGGCVRDSLMGIEPHDYDMASNAEVDEIKRCFRGQTLVTAGEKHGTVGVVTKEKHVIEITTYRTDGEYKDHRHPEKVVFAKSITEDLARRDFTINAIAYNGEYADPFGGAEDIKNKIIRTVGDPDRRFDEDALRMLRALRFQSKLGFGVEKATAESIHKNKNLLKSISAERVFAEFKEILCGDYAEKALTEFSDVIEVFIPEISPCINFDQQSRYHIYDVYTHIVKTIANSPKDASLRLAAFFHDIAKPRCFSLDEKGGHFYTHPEKSAVIAENVLERLKCDGKTKSLVVQLVKDHDRELMPDRKSVKRFLLKNSPDYFDMFIAIKRADNLAHAPFTFEYQKTLDKLSQIKENIMESEGALSLKTLNINGRDLMDIGIKDGKTIGRILNELLLLAADEKVPNEKAALIRAAENIMDK